MAYFKGLVKGIQRMAGGQTSPRPQRSFGEADVARMEKLPMRFGGGSKFANLLRQQPGYQRSPATGVAGGGETLGGMAALGTPRTRRPAPTGGAGVSTLTRKRKRIGQSGSPGALTRHQGRSGLSLGGMVAPAAGAPSPLSRRVQPGSAPRSRAGRAGMYR